MNDKTTRIWANFGWADPNKNLAEINVRECVIFPQNQGLKHIVIDGFEVKHAASNWAPPDQFQKGAKNVMPGPFQNIKKGSNLFEVWLKANQ